MWHESASFIVSCCFWTSHLHRYHYFICKWTPLSLSAPVKANNIIENGEISCRRQCLWSASWNKWPFVKGMRQQRDDGKSKWGCLVGDSMGQSSRKWMWLMLYVCTYVCMHQTDARSFKKELWKLMHSMMIQYQHSKNIITWINNKNEWWWEEKEPQQKGYMHYVTC